MLARGGLRVGRWSWRRMLRGLLACGSVVASSSSSVPALAADDAPAPEGVIAEGTRWATNYYVVQAAEAGPTVMVISGVHGDEQAGPVAADDMRSWPLVRGRLILVPRANQPALARGTRRTLDTRYPDLNRNFPVHDGDAPRGTMARALWSVLIATHPDWVVDMHEGFDFHRVNAKSVGSSVLYFPTDTNRHQASRLMRAVNRTVTLDVHRFVLLRPPVRGSFSRAASQLLGIPAMILETTKKDQPLATRVAQHHLMMAQLLGDLGMLAGTDAPTARPRSGS